MESKLVNYYSSKLSTLQQVAYRQIVQGLSNFQTAIHVPSGLTCDELRYTIDTVFREHPEFYYVDTHDFTTRWGVGITAVFQFLYSLNEVKKLDSLLHQAEQKMKLGDCQSDLKAAVKAHNFLVRNCSYEDQIMREENYNIIGPLIYGRAVCEGFAKAYQYLMQRRGVDVMLVKGVAADPVQTGSQIVNERHAWNIISLNGIPAHVDVTWDLNLSHPVRFTRYDYFAISDRWMKRDHQFTDVPSCISDSHSYFVQNRKYFNDERDLEKHCQKQGEKFYFKVSDQFPEKLKDPSDLVGFLSLSITNRRVVNASVSWNPAQNCYLLCWR